MVYGRLFDAAGRDDTGRRHQETHTVIGESYGHEEAPGRSVAIVTRAATEYYDWNIEDATIAIQGFGSVGTNTARLLDGWGADVVAVSEVDSAIYDLDGLNPESMEGHDEQPDMVSGYNAPRR
ncbi:Rossmann-fold NAD(P)-binding domain-containing protein [Halarchaeum acidiphilum]|uniref:hypothetical protein n=1 Tax=Halarchaeum acidiphilum TaxID=489138 RepID=UPI00037141DB|nr:hypothetical protein [Halarchaeum acidiphilum]